MKQDNSIRDMFTAGDEEHDPEPSYASAALYAYLAGWGVIAIAGVTVWMWAAVMYPEYAFVNGKTAWPSGLFPAWLVSLFAAAYVVVGVSGAGGYFTVSFARKAVSDWKEASR